MRSDFLNEQTLLETEIKRLQQQDVVDISPIETPTKITSKKIRVKRLPFLPSDSPGYRIAHESSNEQTELKQWDSYRGFSQYTTCFC